MEMIEKHCHFFFASEIFVDQKYITNLMPQSLQANSLEIYLKKSNPADG